VSCSFGIIGYGKMGQIRHETINQLGIGKVIAISEPHIEKDVGNIPNFSIDEVINHPEIEAIFICTPNFLNKKLTIRSMLAGKHVFCEKPPCFTGKDMLEIKKVESEAGVKLMYGFNHRHHDSIIKMKEIIDNGDLGNILWMRGRYGKSVSSDFYSDWRAKKELAGGGILLDQGIHMLDLLLYFGGEYDEIKADVSNLYWNLDIEDNVFAILKNTKSKVVASLHSTMTQWRHLFSLEVFLEKGHMVLNGLITSSMSYGDEVLSIARNKLEAPSVVFNDEMVTRYETNNSWKYEVEHFIEAINEDTPISIGCSEDASLIMNTIDKIYKERDF